MTAMVRMTGGTNIRMVITVSDIIKSISYDQDELLQWIIRLYVDEGRFDLDPTFSTGGFYRKIPQPKLCYDLVPQRDNVVQADCRKLPLQSGSIRSIIIDPPFLATTGKSLAGNTGNIINRRFSVARSERELAALYEATIMEANRVLCPGGILVFKCQDKVSSGKQYMMHCNVYQWAILQGFEVLDLFILLARSRLVANWQRNQKHARKYHCYFWVFRKRKGVVPVCGKST